MARRYKCLSAIVNLKLSPSLLSFAPACLEKIPTLPARVCVDIFLARLPDLGASMAGLLARNWLPADHLFAY